MADALTLDPEWNQKFMDRDPLALLEHVYRQYGPEVTLASSFGAEDVVLVDMACQVTAAPEVFCLDTGLLFPETYALIERIVARYPIRYRAVQPRLSVAEQASEFGPELWARDPAACCGLRKVEPLLRALDSKRAWITGIRRDQSPTRKNAQLMEWDDAHDLVKVNPLAYWSHEMVWEYIKRHGLDYNPLHDHHFPSIGCVPCTRAVEPGEPLRSGRWAGFEKTECGLHSGS